MPVPPHSRVINLTREENRKVEWLSARRGQTAHAYLVGLIRKHLGRQPDPPYFEPPASDESESG